jgi:hypothetical protein
MQEVAENAEKMRVAWREAQLDEDVKVDSWKSLTEYLQDNAAILPEIDDSLEENKIAA